MPTEMIDLGDDWALPREQPRATPLSVLRRRVAYALVLLLVATLGAAGVPARRVAELGRHRLEGVTDQVVGDILHPVDDLVLVQGGAALSAYQTADGALRWSAPHTSAAADRGYVTGAAGVVLSIDGGQTTTAFDAKSGARLWSAPRSVYPVAGVGMDVRNRTGDFSEQPTPGAPPPGTDSVTGVDLRTGATLWTVPGTPFATVDSERGLVVTVTNDGALAVYDVHGASLLRRGEAKFPPGRPMYVAAFQGTVQLAAASAEPDGGLGYLDYDLTTMRPLAREDGTPYRCGRYRCVDRVDRNTVDFFQITVTDPVTRAPLWTLEAKSSLLAVTDGFVVLDVGQSSGVRGTDALRLVDPATGRTLVDLTGWLALGAVDGSDGYVLLRDVGKTTQVAKVVAGAVRVLGVLPHRAQRCLYRTDRLTCLFDDDQLGIWRVDGQRGR
ncbi:PQQ-binding-like beta-propeller repeat protein [Catellatospora sp. KI3]|uniref:outer membrane protein assembly factor BamB family protein n=1 Tax=Catellatospora sp. KI3 TaxID=3041620 RepID=UPI0024829693|nr:PQQ-binding-like beta-propeller repeat protein [Catellatospora sp. KI3]MDI1464955.1 PQQ-binding-like beta-propeller repeat protein [Catellatospora sp. KI3]